MKIIKHFILFGIIWIIQLCICVRIPIQQVSDSFSIEELNKIKFLIKFAKTNNIMDNIVEMKGNFMFNDTSKWNLTGFNEENEELKEIKLINDKISKINEQLNKIEELLKNNNKEKTIEKKPKNIFEELSKGNAQFSQEKEKKKEKKEKKENNYSPLLMGKNHFNLDDDEEYIHNTIAKTTPK